MSAIDELRHSYRSGHASRVSGSLYRDPRTQWPYFSANYQALSALPRSSRIVEIGPGSGALLMWMRQLGFEDLRGIEVAAEEVAALLEQGLPIVQGDAMEVLAREPSESIDAIVFKAVLEHMSKDAAVALLREIARVVRPSGLVLVDVPNMGWLLSGHERYMDLTHETGYTKESLRQLLSLFFYEVDVVPSCEPVTSIKGAIRVRLFRPMLVAAIRLALRVLGEGASAVPFESRSVIGVAHKPRK